MPETTRIMDRLGRRGVLTVTVEAGSFEVSFKAPGPYLGRAWCTTDEADLYEYCRLGAKDWQGAGHDLDALLVLCEMETRPDNNDIDDLVWKIERRRDSRTFGPPLPSYMGWHRGGWRPGDGRWLRTFDHKYEYLDGYLRYREIERKDKAERHQADMRRKAAERRRVKAVLNA